MLAAPAVLVACAAIFLAVSGCGGGVSCPAQQSMCGGACADLTRDPAHCGACGAQCAPGKLCVAGQCATSCPTGESECGGSCRDLMTDRAHCGACGQACSDGQVCAAGACMASCPTGFTVCANVCRELMTDPANCGGCGKACKPGEACSKGTCGASCQAGLTNCNGSCRDLMSDTANCNACGAACTPGQVCSLGKCALTCQPELTPCGGVCRDLMSDLANCGACGTACLPGQVCSKGACALSCQQQLTSCSGVCRDLLSDANNCGACGKACGVNQVCSGGKCNLLCPMGTVVCGNGCANLQIDPANCGACNNACGAPANASGVCAGGTCKALCNAGFADCDGQLVSGCEGDLRNDINNCGGCAKACGGVANGTSSCASGSCKVMCNASFGDCDGLFGNGCEIDFRNDLNNCGGCNKPCGGNTPYCLSGVCGVLGSCKAIKAANPFSASATYSIDPDGPGGNPAFTTFCDMSTAGGGWTLLVNRITESDNNGQPDVNTTAGVFDNNRLTNFTINVNQLYAGAADFAFAVKHNGACSSCTIAQYDSAIQVPRSAGNAFSITCPATEQVAATKLAGPSAGQVLVGFRCTGSLGWGNCGPNVCHYGVHGQNTASDGAWSQNTPSEMHFPSAYSMYRAYVASGGYCRSCGGGLLPGSFNPLSSTCCNQANSPDNSTWTIWAR